MQAAFCPGASSWCHLEYRSAMGATEMTISEPAVRLIEKIAEERGAVERRD
jgi:hypothetical protein